MDLQFRSFSFVDRIHAAEAGKQIRGRYTIPDRVTRFPNSLVAEAVGQLAAWAAMAAVDFEYRPVAGLAGRVELISLVSPGQTLELAADVESVDEEAVAYGGTASLDGKPVLTLEHCVGPMMPMAEFSDPEQVRNRFDLLNGDGAEPAAFEGVPDIALLEQEMTSEASIRATLHVPEKAAFFSDHFPRKPVFPGTLLTHANLQLAARLIERIAPSANGTPWLPRTICDVKLRAFIAPGETLELEAQSKAASDRVATVAMQIRAGGKRIGSCRVDLEREAAQ